ncbi:hypothetical protein CYLTODRAFT_493291 [Cylindrobasidium torrendii FP15055 ss-10]|uniref:Uncharacterized protein n=1 Tax=Cylindrobasidium torrendii FP15055 ss-10 TaxID=1314674 RepID=A0A0D7B165_9AGAR|nr:hypothetical protein CYLTODRAFT_493291 [Cylindrobasidium torrendii FP15055 ss-10]
MDTNAKMETMDVDMGMQSDPAPLQTSESHAEVKMESEIPANQPALSLTPREFREIQVKVHIRRPERDSWVYLGRAVAMQELVGHSSRIVVRSITSQKILTSFGEGSDLQAERRGNFVVISCVEASRVVSWSLNALNNSDTIRLITSIELACYKSKQALMDPRLHSKARRRIEKIIKEDRRRRHRRRKDQDALVDAFSKQRLDAPSSPMDANEPDL